MLKEAPRAAVSYWSPVGARQRCWKREAGIPPWGTLCLAAGLLRCLSVPFLLLVMAGGALAAWEVLGDVSGFADTCSMFFPWQTSSPSSPFPNLSSRVNSARFPLPQYLFIKVWIFSLSVSE